MAWFHSQFNTAIVLLADATCDLIVINKTIATASTRMHIAPAIEQVQPDHIPASASFDVTSPRQLKNQLSAICFITSFVACTASILLILAMSLHQQALVYVALSMLFASLLFAIVSFVIIAVALFCFHQSVPHKETEQQRELLASRA